MSSEKLHHYQRLADFVKERLENDLYAEPPSQLHRDITKDMIRRLADHIQLEGKRVLDCGCGQGVALEVFREAGAEATGITFGEDLEICRKRGFDVHEMDQSFLEFPPETFDLVWCRHALEHSLFPLFTLRGFFDVLKADGILYVEVPAPGTSARHEYNLNHYSCFTQGAWLSLFQRSGFDVLDTMDLKFRVACGDDLYHSFFLKKVNKGAQG